jgi:hypothetical protein
MYFSMSRKQEIMMTKFMRNGMDLLMKELKKSSSSNQQNSHHSNSHNRSDSSSSRKKDSVIWTLQAVTVHVEAKIDLHKVGRKIIS